MLALGVLLAATPVQAQTTVSRAGLTVTYHDPGDARHLEAVFRAWGEGRAELAALGLKVPPTQLRAARDAADFAARAREGPSIAASTRGQVIQTQRLGALAGRGLLPLTLRHELFHVAQPPGLPRWLAEGLARVFSGEARRDPPGATGLETLSPAGLDARLLGRAPGEAGRAYTEASRRAAALVRRVGWRAALRAGGLPPQQPANR